MKTLRGAVFGAGVMGAYHARMLRQAAGVELVGVVDTDADKRAQVAGALGCGGFADIAEALDAGLDFAVVATPNHLHAPLAEQLLTNGVHVLVEKPIANTPEEARRLIAAADVAGRLLMVGHVERFNPAVLAAKAACEGERVVSVSITRAGPFPPRMADVGVIMDLAVHDVDIVRYITGSDIAEVSCQHDRVHGSRQDVALILARTESGASAQIDCNWLTPFRVRQMKIATATKFIVADLITRQVVEHSAFMPNGAYTTRHLFVRQAEPLQLEHEAFLEAIRNGAPAPVTGWDGLRNLEIALSCIGGEAA
ncbi:oxidoreductase [Caulobacter sp. Root487D2Y]|jgi:predicted dehydrogenase|uniref:Gfo/Idh/MocA family protein n=1 Tax=Caulobacter sp. Root487D2Y TaxID=1736547 RepID=UPI0006FD38C4|nr:Gfo/Idh/MocA family oxidoreductase [Caulobacter sp. Root487D2Y]KQY35276.1 oxidoreductase [Caulobacter sp. Root487D2Y]